MKRSSLHLPLHPAVLTVPTNDFRLQESECFTVTLVQDPSGQGRPAAPELDPHPRPHGETRRATPGRTQRFGAAPFIFLVDVLALGTGWLLSGGSVNGFFPALLILTVYMTGGLYRSRLRLSVLGDLPALVGRGLSCSLVVAAAQSLLGEKPRLATAVLSALSILVLGRWFAYSAVRHARRKRWVSHRTLIVGAGRVGTQLFDLLQSHPECGLTPVGALERGIRLDHHPRGLPILGPPEDLANAVRQLNVGVVIVAFGQVRESEMVAFLRTCDRLDCDIFFVPRLFELGAYTASEVVWGIPLVQVRRTVFRPTARVVKRSMDLLLAGIALTVASPMILLAALGVRLEGGPGVIFRQQRIGLDGRPFTMLKLRSLTPGDEQESEERWSIAQEKKVGPVGRFLRRTSIDELPQLLNVLRGDMSIVGPRPERPYFVQEFAGAYPHYMARHRLPSGLTGWAQVNGLRGNTSIEDRARFDNAYIENWSLWLDIKIILLTLSQVFRASEH